MDLIEALDVLFCCMQCLFVQKHAEGFDCIVIDVVRFIKHHDTVLLEVTRHRLCHFRIDHVLVVEHNDVGIGDRMPCQEVRTPTTFPSESTQIAQSVYTYSKCDAAATGNVDGPEGMLISESCSALSYFS